jgi:TolB-like protein
VISLKKSLFLAIALWMGGCANVANYRPGQHIPTDGTIAVLPFKNYTDSPMAGEKAKNILESILVSEGMPVRIVTRKCDPDHLGQCLRKIRSRYYVRGNVNEWRYKTGLDAEPAVAVGFNIVDRTSGRAVYTAVGAKSGWGQESVGSVAQKLFVELTER